MTEELSLTEFSEAVERTIAAGGARITLHLDHSRVHDAVEAVPRRGGILNALSRTLFRLLPRNLDAEGFLDLAERRAMFDQGYTALVQLDSQVWSGRPGRELSSLTVGTVPWYCAPLSLFDAVTEVTALDDHGVDDGSTSSWRHVTVVSTAHGEEEKVEVWLDDAHVRKLTLGRDATSMSLDEFGIDVDALDWTRLPDYQANATP